MPSGYSEETAEDLYENAPCGYLSTTLDGTIVMVNRTFESLTSFSRDELLTGTRFQELLSPGGQIYYETHFAPLLRMQGVVREIAVDIVRADGSRLSALVNSALRHDDQGNPRAIRTIIFDATDRRGYEQELVKAREREHEIALELQRGMLSGPLPAGPDLDLGVAYRAGVRALEVGGDWYDAFWLQPDQTVQLVVGDVVGRGIEAAATMGQLRSATRAFASRSSGPEHLLDSLDGFVRRHGVGQMATLVCAELHLNSGLLRYACAGHPPPVIARPGEEPQMVWQGRSVPLDGYAGTPPDRGDGACELESGCVVVLYTDGLIERRRRSIDEGMDRLNEEIAAHRNRPSTELATAVLEALAEDEHSDDVCLLAARLC